jgi:hypothetical protein
MEMQVEAEMRSRLPCKLVHDVVLARLDSVLFAILLVLGNDCRDG